MLKTENSYAYARTLSNCAWRQCALPFHVVWVAPNGKVDHTPCTDLFNAARVAARGCYYLVRDTRTGQCVDQLVIAPLVAASRD